MADKKNTVHILLTYHDDDDETYVDVFTSKSAVVDHVVGLIRQEWEEMHWEEDVSDEDRKYLYDTQDEATKALNEHGYWRDGGDETTYVYEEKEYTA